jgi:hypothetical protein
MEKYHLNIEKVIEKAKDIKGLVDVAWLFKLRKNDEIVLEVDSQNGNVLLLRVLLIILTVEILRNNPSLRTEENESINYPEIKVENYETLAKALTKILGVKFSLEDK